MTKFPKIIFIGREKDGDTSYLLSWEELDEANDGELAVYELKKVGNKSTRSNIDFK